MINDLTDVPGNPSPDDDPLRDPPVIEPPDGPTPDDVPPSDPGEAPPLPQIAPGNESAPDFMRGD
ncbi:MAG: hypothetical protein ABIV26_01430 [Candidatus Limnocylindrales bacterium]